MSSRHWMVALLVCGMGASGAWAGALKDYVDTPDPNFTYSLVGTNPSQGCTIYVIDMTSQSWHEGDVSHPLWKHWVTIAVPDNLKTDTAMLVISGGSNKHDKPPTSIDPIFHMVATMTGSVVAELQGIPNEPVTFSDESRTRTEDEIIAYTFDKYLKTGDPTWPLLCPMVKSAVRAMDVVQEFCASDAGPGEQVSGFVVTGASKRGWTSWLTATVDPRVKGVAPIVIDMLNLTQQMARQLEYYEGFSVAIQDYTDFNLQERFKSPEGRKLMAIVDPFEYREQLTLPKLVLLGSGDQYWTVDAANLYYDDLEGEKRIRYQPNADHDLGDVQQSAKALIAFHHSVITGQPLPDFSWDIKPDGRFRVETEEPPKEVRLWTAHAPTKDFRLMTIGEAWTSEVVEPSSDGAYSGQVPAPQEGYDAFFVEVIYPSSLGFDYSLTTMMTVPGPGGFLASPAMRAGAITVVGILVIGAIALLLRRKLDAA